MKFPTRTTFLLEIQLKPFYSERRHMPSGSEYTNGNDDVIWVLNLITEGWSFTMANHIPSSEISSEIFGSLRHFCPHLTFDVKWNVEPVYCKFLFNKDFYIIWRCQSMPSKRSLKAMLLWNFIAFIIQLVHYVLK